jgi:ribosome-binding protein aMBF1 (putative translation factor)
MDGQDWKTVVFRKPTDVQKKEKSDQQRRLSQRVKTKDDDTGAYAVQKLGKQTGKQIATARLARKMSQKQLASSLHIPLKTVQEYENGKALPSGTLINRLNRALGIKIVHAK